MIYSRWKPDTGGFDYFEASERYGMGDDLPVPKLSGGSSIGVTSIGAGRLPKKGELRFIGSGQVARGSIMPTSREGLSGLGFLDTVSSWTALLLGVVAGLVGSQLIERRRSA